jgi:hypothetical protein
MGLRSRASDSVSSLHRPRSLRSRRDRGRVSDTRRGTPGEREDHGSKNAPPRHASVRRRRVHRGRSALTERSTRDVQPARPIPRNEADVFMGRFPIPTRAWPGRSRPALRRARRGSVCFASIRRPARRCARAGSDGSLRRGSAMLAKLPRLGRLGFGPWIEECPCSLEASERVERALPHLSRGLQRMTAPHASRAADRSGRHRPKPGARTT